MNLKERWGTRRFQGESTKDLIRLSLNEASTGGSVESLEAKVEQLSEIVASLIEHAKLTDQQKLEVCQLQYRWEVTP